MAKPWHERQKEKGVKLVLTWFTPRNCWKKYRSGDVWYFKQPDSAEGYEAAVLEYQQRLNSLKETRQLAPEYQHHIQTLQSCLAWYDRFGTPDDEEGIRTEAENVLQRLKSAFESDGELPDVMDSLPACVTLAEKRFIIQFCDHGIGGTNGTSFFPPQSFGSLGWVPSVVWTARLRQIAQPSARQQKPSQTVGHQVQRFLDFKEAQVRGGVLKARTWGTLAERLNVFLKWIKPGTHVATIDGTTMTGYYQWLLKQDQWGQIRRYGLFSTARQWIQWAWRQDDVELDVLPKNIKCKEEFVFLTHLDNDGVSKKTRTELLWTPDEFHAVLGVVPEDFQLFLLLMLNCGFTNTDLASLLKSEVQLEAGRIVRQRTKTRRHAHPPVVNYLLWPKTATLLRTHWSDHPELALTNHAGNPLGVSKLSQKNGETKETVWSSVGRRFQSAKKDTPTMPRKQLMFLRKSGSSKIRSDTRYMTLDSLYLGHSWASIADKHYNAFDGHPYAPLDEAIQWLGGEFKLL
ncbi:MAG: hypothetical protein AABP62_29580 [Planctomycetota bacterium]